MSTKTKTGHCRQWIICKKCRKVMFYDYTPYGLGNPTVAGRCECGGFCLNSEWDRKLFHFVTAAEAKIQQRINRIKAGRK